MFISLRVVSRLLEMRELLVSLTLLHSMFLKAPINSCYLFNNIKKNNLLWLKSFFPEQLYKYIILNFMTYYDSFSPAKWLSHNESKERVTQNSPRVMPRFMLWTVHRSLPSGSESPGLYHKENHSCYSWALFTKDVTCLLPNFWGQNVVLLPDDITHSRRMVRSLLVPW